MANTYVYLRKGGSIDSLATNKSWEVTKWLETNLTYELNAYAYSYFRGIWRSHQISRSGGISTIEEFPDDIPKEIRAYHLIMQE